MHPRRIIARHLLPLAYLDLAPGDIQCSKLFASSSRTLRPLLEGEHFLLDPHVLIAEDQDGAVLYAVEGVRDDVFALCRVAAWVSLADFGRSEVKTRRIRAPREVPSTEQWWSHAITEPAEEKQATRWAHHTKELQSILRPPPTDAPVVTDLLEASAGVAVDVDTQEQPPSPAPIADSRAEANAVDVLSLLRSQYFEALYMSKMSLAFFTKGPLSRARAICTGPDAKSSDLTNLVEHIRANAYKISAFDLKYSEGLPDLIEDIPPHLTAEDESSALKSFSGTIKRSKKRKKIGKDGFGPGEEEFAIRWWLKQGSAGDTNAFNSEKQNRVRDAVSEQKARETQLQILLNLELFALEPVLMQREKERQDTGEEHKASEKAASEKRSKHEGKRHALLGQLVDKLCIWDSMSLNDSGVPNTESGSAKQGLRSKSSSTERLRSFCTEVIVPL